MYPSSQEQSERDELTIIEDEGTDEVRGTWKILIVDDDPDVHLATRHALDGAEMLGRVPEFFHAESAEAASAILRQEPDIAVILLDVVMETQDAGLALVEHIRNELHLRMSRIVLRTGHPGYAPELSAIRNYDINDYKTKSELTRNRLFTTVLAAIRAYDQLQRMEASRKGLEQIVRASGDLLRETGLPDFAAGVIQQLTALIGLSPEAVLCAQANLNPRVSEDAYVVLAAAGRYRDLIGHHLDEIQDSEIVAALRRCLAQRRHLITQRDLTLYFPLHTHKHFAVYIAAPEPRPEIDRHLLQVFCTNVSLCAENIHLIGRLQEAAYHDHLVDLPNCTACVQAIDQCYEGQIPEDQCLVLIDIDHFAEINNAFGHEYGDQLLKALAQRLRQHLGADCFIARLHADNFALLGREETLNPDRLRPILAEPLRVGTNSHVVGVSTSLVRLKESGPDGWSVLKDASIAHKQCPAKGMGRDAIFTPTMSQRAEERTRLLHRLQRAIDQGWLLSTYQPQIDLTTGQVCGMEALIRWREPTGELVPPNRFIPLAEQTGLIEHIGAWILEESLQTLQDLEREGWHDLRASVNVSSVQIHHPEFLDTIMGIIGRSGVPPDRLELEITETVALMGQKKVEAILGELKALGVHIAIDDFGTGYSSLAYLNRLPLDRIKIDRAFVLAMDREPEGHHVAELIIRLGQGLGIRVIAEGVETEAQVTHLRALGCQEVQGFLYGKPMEEAEFCRWLRDWDPDRCRSQTDSKT